MALTWQLVFPIATAAIAVQMFIHQDYVTGDIGRRKTQDREFPDAILDDRSVKSDWKMFPAQTNNVKKSQTLEDARCIQAGEKDDCEKWKIAKSKPDKPLGMQEAIKTENTVENVVNESEDDAKSELDNKRGQEIVEPIQDAGDYTSDVKLEKETPQNILKRVAEDGSNQETVSKTGILLDADAEDVKEKILEVVDTRAGNWKNKQAIGVQTNSPKDAEGVPGAADTSTSRPEEQETGASQSTVPTKENMSNVDTTKANKSAFESDVLPKKDDPPTTGAEVDKTNSEICDENNSLRDNTEEQAGQHQGDQGIVNKDDHDKLMTIQQNKDKTGTTEMKRERTIHGEISFDVEEHIHTECDGEQQIHSQRDGEQHVHSKVHDEKHSQNGDIGNKLHETVIKDKKNKAKIDSSAQIDIQPDNDLKIHQEDHDNGQDCIKLPPFMDKCPIAVAENLKPTKHVHEIRPADVQITVIGIPESDENNTSDGIETNPEVETQNKVITQYENGHFEEETGVEELGEIKRDVHAEVLVTSAKNEPAAEEECLPESTQN